MSSTSTQSKIEEKTRYHATKYRTGVYPQKRTRELSFNEIFRALFPAALAVVLSFIILSAFNSMGDIQWVHWLQNRSPNENKESKQLNKYYGPLNTYEMLGSKTSSAYWSNLERQKEMKLNEYKRNLKPLDWKKKGERVKYEDLGAKTSSSYWETKGRELEPKIRSKNRFDIFPKGI
ncbi:hypothetical protein DLAC_07828 [Tieghemostelium lacteum]|uniref:Uncharacterized protein n=1 Tax=Tieghemostelium lacteum TaxID=361077 RepID=A0A151ZAJ4_TIELA|nr:hypothetical protein DLAC_07828 [Tieghemostelium lacteum]|eukprot:KYQ90948.1 hypothetical protein DLAC_07828 [Tieghemostelium lacteum]